MSVINDSGGVKARRVTLDSEKQRLVVKSTKEKEKKPIIKKKSRSQASQLGIKVKHPGVVSLSDESLSKEIQQTKEEIKQLDQRARLTHRLKTLENEQNARQREKASRENNNSGFPAFVVAIIALLLFLSIL